MKSTALPSWLYGDPSNIADGLIARTERQEKAAVRKPVLRDKFYRRSKSIRIKGLVKLVKGNGGSSA